MSWNRFNSQFEESMWEVRERQAANRARRTAEGKCWQCAKLIAECRCTNIVRATTDEEVLNDIAAANEAATDDVFNTWGDDEPF